MDRQAIIEQLLDHYASPRHYGPLPDADVILPGGIPTCDDTVTIYLRVAPDGEQIAGLSFEGRGCTVSQAAASLLAEHLQGATLTAIETLDAEAVLVLLGLEVARARPRCATLALTTLKAAVSLYRQARQL